MTSAFKTTKKTSNFVVICIGKSAKADFNKRLVLRVWVREKQPLMDISLVISHFVSILTLILLFPHEIQKVSWYSQGSHPMLFNKVSTSHK